MGERIRFALERFASQRHSSHAAQLWSLDDLERLMNPEHSAPREKSRLPIIGIFSVCTSLLGVVVHLWAGWEDEHRIVFRPVGHLTVIIAFVWLFTLAIALTSVAIERRRRAWACFSLVLAATGLVLLLSR